MKTWTANKVDYGEIFRVIKSYIFKLTGKLEWEVVFADKMRSEDEMYVLGKTIVLNKSVVDAGGTFFGLLFAIHEIHHAIKHNLKFKDTVKRYRELGAMRVIVSFDVEADVMTALFMKETYNWTFDDYLDVYYSGQEIFKSPGIVKPHKFMRFISSLVSVYESMVSGERICDLLDYATLPSEPNQKWVITRNTKDGLSTFTIVNDFYPLWRALYDYEGISSRAEFREAALSLITNYKQSIEQC